MYLYIINTYITAAVLNGNTFLVNTYCGYTFIINTYIAAAVGCTVIISPQ